MNERTKKITTIGMFCAIAYVMVALIRIPIVPAVPFLHYEPKDVIIAMAGFIYGPVASLLISVITAFLEMVTFSSTGIWGFVMNVLSSCSFACVAALIYHKRKSFARAALSLLCGAAVMVALMMLWNYLITPIYMGYPREAVADMLLPAFLPFNAIKGGLNAVFTLVLYQPLTAGLKKARLLA